MILSRRERLVGILAGTVLGLWLLDRYIITPLTNTRAQIRQDLDAVQVQHDRASVLLESTRRMSHRWDEMQKSGLGADASASESQVLHAVRDWAQESGLTLSSIKPERTEKLKQFQQITIRAAATGNMRAASRFFFRVQSSKIPVRISDMTISSRKEGTDDLSLQLGISTIFLPPAPPKAGEQRPPATATASRDLEVER